MSDPQLLGDGIEGTYPTDSITTAGNGDGYAFPKPSCIFPPNMIIQS